MKKPNNNSNNIIKEKRFAVRINFKHPKAKKPFWRYIVTSNKTGYEYTLLDVPALGKGFDNDWFVTIFYREHSEDMLTMKSRVWHMLKREFVKNNVKIYDKFGYEHKATKLMQSLTMIPDSKLR